MPGFRCEHCRQKIAARDEYAGRRVRCPRCKQAVRVPNPELAAAQAPAVAVEPVAPAPTKPKPVAAPPAAPPRPAPIYTRQPPQDFSTIFSAPLDELFGSSAHDYSPEEQTQVLRPVHPVEGRPPAEPTFDEQYSDLPGVGHPPEPAKPPEILQPPVVLEPAEVIDAPAPMRSSLQSSNEVADLLRGLDNPAQRARLAAASAASDAAARRQVVASSRATRALGWMSLAVGAIAVGLSCVPLTARFGVPVGAAGLLLAMTGLSLAVGRRSGVGLPIGGAVMSAAGLGAALFWAFGVLPLGAGGAFGSHGNTTPPVTLVANSQPARPGEAGDSPEYVPATSPLIVNHVQVRVGSAILLHPAVYKGEYETHQILGERRLQITLELKNLGSDRVVYQPWRIDAAHDERIALTGPDGIALASDGWAFPDEEHWLAAEALRGPALLGQQPTSDVLLFMPPAGPVGDLRLDLPGKNIGQPDTTLHIRIPASMVRVQGEERMTR
jgi:phage FluMu protein Com